MFYIYILYSTDLGRYYIGHSSDVCRRLEEHNHQVVKSKFTAKSQHWELVLSFEVSEHRGDAMKVERFIKKQKSRQFIRELIDKKNNGQYFRDLNKNILKMK